ncbi:Dabb family protein [Streptomyces sp. NPDC059255]|uniref:Dabb family protein n=1 Tax=Streptomyces sp. NPDC059255 TaxID=3346793 RepID=UPI00367548DD
MIYHSVRLKAKVGVTREQIDEALETMRDQGRNIPAVKSFVVGREFGGGFDCGGVFVIEDLDGYWEYLTHPAHARADRIGMALVEDYEWSDTVDDDDPLMGEKIADLQRRWYESTLAPVS